MKGGEVMRVVNVKDSSVIVKIAYDGEDIFVKFKENGWYRFRSLSEEVFDEFCSAKSKGTFLNTRLKHLRKGTRCANPEL